MEDNNRTYRMPEGFDPFDSVNHIRALTDALHQLVTEGEMTQRPAPQAAYSNLVSLLELLQPEVHALHAYLREIENATTLELPMSDADFKAISVGRHFVKETAAVYSIR